MIRRAPRDPSPPTSPSPLAPEAAASERDWRRIAGYAMIGVGLALIICRFALWPLTVPGHVRVLFFAGIGLVAGGRAVARTGGVGYRHEVPALIVAGAITAAFLLLVVAPGPLAETPLETVEAPGLRVSMPEGDRTIGGEQRHGQIKVEGIGGRRGLMQVSWSPGAGLTQEELAAALDVVRREFDGGPFEPAAEPLEVSGHPATTLVSGDGDTGVVATAWSCEEHGRGFIAMTGAPEPRAEVAELHRRVLDSVECHIGEAPESLWVLPAFPAEISIGHVADSDPPTFVTGGGELVLFNIAETEVPARLEEHPDVVRGLLSMDPSSTVISMQERPIELSRDRGEKRKLWRAVVDIEEQRYAVNIAAMHCEGYALLGLSYRWLEDGGELPPSETLRLARCPGEGDPAPRPAAELAREVCTAGELDACAFFVEAEIASETLEAWIREGCDSGVAAACAYFEELEPEAAP